MQATHEVVSARVETKGADAERGSHRWPDWKLKWQSQLEVQQRQRDQDPEHQRKNRGNQRQQHILYAETHPDGAEARADGVQNGRVVDLPRAMACHHTR